MRFVESLNAIVGSIPFEVAYAFANAYSVQKTCTANDSLLRMIVCTICLAFGGGILTHIFLGEPIKLFFNPILLPIYTSCAVLVHFYMFEFLDLNSEIFDPIFTIVDGLARGAALPRFLLMFRSIQAGPFTGRNSFSGQIVLGYLSITGGGILFKWLFRGQPYQLPFFTLILSVTLVSIILLELIDDVPGAVHKFLSPLTPFVDPNVFGFNELKAMNGILLAFGFLYKIGEEITIRPSLSEERSPRSPSTPRKSRSRSTSKKRK
ncbi:hypothetical protein HK103_002686 [Boothiomyces macroporosus]|uniref:Uncharacterized protein n=1 Tax=Boothiomyces macroporosus TaxID=261099 RepID=A0AAD5Y8N0_9FUNG|nr:hypothetical protein HK103_002686 [Boothiomyces macroporosus]